MALLVEHATLDLGVVSLRPTLYVEIMLKTKKKFLRRKSFPWMLPTTQIRVFARPQMSGGIGAWTTSSLLHSFSPEISSSHMALITIHVLPTTN